MIQQNPEGLESEYILDFAIAMASGDNKNTRKKTQKLYYMLVMWQTQKRVHRRLSVCFVQHQNKVKFMLQHNRG